MYSDSAAMYSDSGCQGVGKQGTHAIRVTETNMFGAPVGCVAWRTRVDTGGGKPIG